MFAAKRCCICNKNKSKRIINNSPKKVSISLRDFLIKTNSTMRFQKIITSLIILLGFISTSLFAQDEKIITWKATPQKISENNYKVTFTGTIKSGWHIYATENKAAELGGLNTTKEDSNVVLKNFLLVSKTTTSLNDVVPAKDLQIITDSVTFTQEVNITGKKISAFNIFINYEVANKDSFYPEYDTLKILTGDKVAATSSNRILVPSINVEKPLTDIKTSSSLVKDEKKSTGLLAIFFLGFLGGLASLIMPCIFPMIPLTVSFFTKKAQSKKVGIRNAFLYGFFIFLIYILITVPFHIFDKLNPNIFNGISTNVILNVIFFVVFVIFALSFFGLFEITLPSGLTNSTDSKANAGTITGIFFMALTLTIVSFSCTGPIAGSLLAGAVSGPTGGAMRLTFGMAGFGAALGLPFALFAMFPEMLKSLPKSGGWLTTVKVVLGFLELAMALKFLSNADLVKHWGLLKREIFLGLWIIIFASQSLYLWGVYKFKHDSPIKKLGGMRIAFALFFTAFTIYLIPGVTNTKYANLKLISGFPPPLYYSIYGNGECVLNLNCSHDYEEGLKMAKEQNKAILIDFTGYACVNCRRMEEKVWSNEKVYKLLSEKFIVISLYVDDKKLLPQENRFTYTTKDGAVREIRTVGDKWSAFETENFKENSQPHYAVLNTNEELVSHPSGVASTEEYLQWLQSSLDAAVKK